MPRGEKSRLFYAEKKARIPELAKDYTITEIADILDVKYDAVRRWCIEQGVTAKPKQKVIKQKPVCKQPEQDSVDRKGVKCTQAVMNKCKWGSDVCCCYLIRTGHRRPCPADDCTMYEIGKRERLYG